MIKPTIDLESSLWNKGYLNVCGIDEAGRGPLAGPLVVGAVMVNKEDQFLDGVRDSKTMSEKQREFFFEEIKNRSFSWGVGIVDSLDIDELGLTKSIHKAISLALECLDSPPNYILLDGGISMDLDCDCRSINKGDNFHYCISAASVLAKVTRDRLMKEYSITYPEYSFDKHVGYGTKVHLEALDRYGPCKIHRKSFKPIAKFF